MTIVLVHGVLETERIWDRLRDQLNQKSVTLALPGHDCPRPLGFTATKDAYAEWLAGELESIDEPVDLVGHDWGALLCLRAATALDCRPRSWTVDMAHIYHREYVWHRLARIWQTPGVGEEWMRSTAEASPGTPGSGAARFRSLGIPDPEAELMAAAHDETMSRCVLDLYRSALPNLAADWHLPSRPIIARGLVLTSSTDPPDQQVMARDVAGMLGAEVEPVAELGYAWMEQSPKRPAARLERFLASL